MIIHYSGRVQGVGFRYTARTVATGFEITADPITENSSGIRHFFIDESGVIRYSRGDSPANADSTPLE